MIIKTWLKGVALSGLTATSCRRDLTSDLRHQASDKAATIAPKSAAFRLAPPTNAPSTLATAKISDALEGFTDPP